MDIRNVQKTGDMFYLYLPTRWCKKNHITGKSKVGVKIESDGALAIYPKEVPLKPAHLKLKVDGSNMNTLHKLIIACYTSPASSFKISINKELDITKVLNQKKLISLELVEMGKQSITCESTLQGGDPLLLLITMVRKISNLLRVMLENAPQELMDRYEEEIDRSKLLIEKSALSSLVQPAEAGLKPVDVYFISAISKELEHMTDHLVSLQASKGFLKKIIVILSTLQKLLDDRDSLTHTSVMPFLEDIDSIQKYKETSEREFNIHRVVRSLNSISETMIDWAVTREVSG